MKILLVEDLQVQQRAFENAVNALKDKNDMTIEHDIVEDVGGAVKAIDGSCDGAIIDLRLGDDEEGGNEIVRQLGDPFTRIPIIFVTGYVESVDDHLSVIRKRSRDDGTYESDLLLFKEIFDTGLTRIMGGRGDIEKHLTEVFLKNLLPQRETWVSYAKEKPIRAKNALLRYALNHLFQLLEEDDGRCYPEEVYLHPPLSGNITTGTIVHDKAGNHHFVVLSPACDLVIRRSTAFKTDRILLVEIEKEKDIVGAALDGIKQNRKKKDKLQAVFNNNHTDYYHWLPKVDFFNGGFLNFRKVKALTKDEFDENFENPSIQISPFFVKDIVARFSSFYARQGQPDIDSSAFVAHYTQQQTTEQ